MRLERGGLLRLPALRRRGNFVERRHLVIPAQEAVPVVPPIGPVLAGALVVRPLAGDEERRRWRIDMARHHYLGCSTLVAEALSYTAWAGEEAVAHLGWAAAALRNDPRDHYLGWDEPTKHRRLVVDRYNAYNKMPVPLQYCYAHLLREVKDCAREFEDNVEVQRFVEVFAPLLASAMALRGVATSKDDFRRHARALKQILKAVKAPALHPAIHQGIFRDHPERLYHWATDRSVPAENNLAERELQPLVISPKVSFGSQSDAGARTREIVMTTLVTLRRRRPEDYLQRFKSALDELARNEHRDPYDLVFRDRSPPGVTGS